MHVSGAFWLAFAATLTPLYNAEGAYMPGGSFADAGIEAFYASFGQSLLSFREACNGANFAPQALHCSS